MVGIAFGMRTFFPRDVSPSSNWLLSKWRIHNALDLAGFQSAPRPRFSSHMAHTSTFFGKQTIWTVAVPGFPDWHPRLDAAQRVMLNFTKKKLGLFWKKRQEKEIESAVSKHSAWSRRVISELPDANIFGQLYHIFGCFSLIFWWFIENQIV